MATPTRPPIPITVIGGYLGAGKTTLLNRLIGDPGGRRLGVIVNDFGSIGVDAELLAAASDTGVVNLPNGCVCCSLGGDLFESLRTLRAADVPLDQIVIEASGVADPTVAAAWGTSAGFEPGGVIVLAAADSIRRQLVDKYIGGEVRRQLVGADLVLLTKSDLCSATDLDKAFSAVRAVSDSETIDRSDVPIDVVLGFRPTAVARAIDAGHGGRYVRWTWAGGAMSGDRLAELLDDLPVGLLRLKGWIEVDGDHVLVQAVGRTATVVPATSVAPGSRLEAIGISGRLDAGAFTERFDAAVR